MAIVVIDPGHGDVYDKSLDPGAIGVGGAQEKDQALTLSLALGKALEKLGHCVIFTRTSDINKKQKRFKWRTDISNNANADVFLSIHINFVENKPNVNYFMVGYLSRNGKNLASAIASSVDQPDYSSIKIERHRYKVLRFTDATAVLIEAGFITNPNNASIITSQDFINQLANGVNAGIGGNGDGCGCDQN